jgi:hypothetical protein
MFIVARALQGLGAAAGLVIPRAIITDRFQGREIVKLFSALTQVGVSNQFGMAGPCLYRSVIVRVH